MKAHFPGIVFIIVLICAVCAVSAEVAFAETEAAFMGARLPLLEEETPLSSDCALGGLAADAVRHASGAELAIVPSGLLAGDLPQGRVERRDFEAVFRENAALASVSVTPAQLCALLEHSVSHIEADMQTETINRENSAWEGFAQVSGFTFRYDATAPVGQRLYRLELVDGTGLDLQDDETLYTLAGPLDYLAEVCGYPVPADKTPLGPGLTDALETYITDRGTSIAEVSYDRITAIGVGDNQLIGMLPRWMVFAALAALVVFFSALRLKPVWKEYHFEGEMK